MNLLDLILIAFSITSGIFALSLVANVQKCLSTLEKIRLTALFTFIPASLLWIGYWIGVIILAFMKWTNEWVFIFLEIIIGIRMILRSLKTPPENLTYRYGDFKVVFVLAVALGLPAFIIGIGFAFTKIEINLFLIPMIVFGIFLSISGMIIGKRTGNYSMGNKAMFLGGIMFVGLALKNAILFLGII